MLSAGILPGLAERHTPKGIHDYYGLPYNGLQANLDGNGIAAPGRNYFLPSCSRVLAMIMRKWFASLLSGGRLFISRSHNPSACLYSPF